MRPLTLARLRLYETIAATATSVDTVRDAARAAAILSPAEASGCDGCGIDYDADVTDHAPAELGLGPAATSVDANGDPDVTICPFCIFEHEDDDPYEDLDAELAARRLEERDALDSMGGPR